MSRIVESNTACARSGSVPSISSKEPRRSANITVTSLRSPWMAARARRMRSARYRGVCASTGVTPLAKGTPIGRPQPPQKLARDELTKPQCVQELGETCDPQRGHLPPSLHAAPHAEHRTRLVYLSSFSRGRPSAAPICRRVRTLSSANPDVASQLQVDHRRHRPEIHLDTRQNLRRFELLAKQSLSAHAQLNARLFQLLEYRDVRVVHTVVARLVDLVGQDGVAATLMEH